MAAISRYSGDTDSLYAFDGAAPEGEGYVPAAVSDTPAAGAWYEYWLVLDNAYEGEVNTGTYSIYRRDPDETHPRQLQWLDGEGPALAELPFRDQSVDSFKTLVLGKFLGFSKWLIDDIYVSEGACLSNPVEGEACESWGRYPLIDGYADTADWLGWVYAAEAPWIHGPSTGWLYAPNVPDASGGWAYIVR